MHLTLSHCRFIMVFVPFFASAANAQITTEALIEPNRQSVAATLGDALLIIGGATGGRARDNASYIGHGGNYRWTSLPPMKQPRMGLAAVSLPNEVIIAGGTDGETASKSVEKISDFKKGWTDIPPMAHGRSGLALYAIGQDLFAVGGRETTGITGACEHMGRWRRSWKECNRIPIPTAFPAYAVLAGEAWFIGGILRRDGKESPTDLVWIYDPKSDLWRKGPKLPFPISHSAAVSVGNKIIITGGINSSGSPVSSVLAYDQATNGWAEITSLPTPRGQVSSVVWQGHLAVLGGWNAGLQGLRVVEYFSLERRVWSTIAEKFEEPPAYMLPVILAPSDQTDILSAQARLSAPRWGAALIDYDGKPTLIGGADKNRFLNFVETLETGGYEWRALAPLRRARAGLAAAADGKKIAATGGSDQGGPMNDAEIYDPEAHDWFPIAPMLKARSGHALAWMSNGRLCAWGGVGRDGPEPGFECWDGKAWRMGEISPSKYTVTPVFDAAHSVIPNRGSATMILSFGGKSSIFGKVNLTATGSSFGGYPSEKPGIQAADIGGSCCVMSMPTPRANAAVASQNFDYYVAGGIDASEAPSSKLEIYSGNKRWTVAAPMPTPRSHANAYFRGGHLFVVGGKDSEGNALDLIESYDPKTNRWASTSRHERGVTRGNISVDNEKITPRFPIRPHDIAVIIGIDRYRSLPAATYAENDARGYKRSFLSIGVPEENIVLLNGERASRNDIVKYLEEWLPGQTQPDSRIFIVYSGHGAPKPEDGTAYLVPWDGDASFLKTTAYALDQLFDRLNSLRAQQIFVFIDACFSGSGGRSVIAHGIRPMVTVRTKAKTWDHLTIFSASEFSQIAGGLDDKKLGLFSYYVLEAIGGGADMNGDKHLTAAELQAYVRRRVVIDARRNGREQTPTLAATDPNVKIY